MRKAFTLIELLVVIAILAVLISILVPALRGARRAARQTLCLVNERNVAMALRQYSDEHDGRFHALWANDALRFRAVAGNRFQLLPNYLLLPNGALNRTAKVAYWAAIYDAYLGVSVSPEYYSVRGFGPQPYLGGWENTNCPEARYTLPAFRRIAGTGTPGDNEGSGSGAEFPDDPYTLYSTYCFNGVTPGFSNVVDVGYPTLFVGGQSDSDAAPEFRQPNDINKLTVPSDMILFHDGSEVMLDGNGDTLFQLTQWTSAVEGAEKQKWIEEYFRHPGGCAVAWADGHASMISRGKAEDIRASWQAERPTMGLGGRPLTQRIPFYTAPF